MKYQIGYMENKNKKALELEASIKNFFYIAGLIGSLIMSGYGPVIK